MRYLLPESVSWQAFAKKRWNMDKHCILRGRIWNLDFSRKSWIKEMLGIPVIPMMQWKENGIVIMRALHDLILMFIIQNQQAVKSVGGRSKFVCFGSSVMVSARFQTVQRIRSLKDTAWRDSKIAEHFPLVEFLAHTLVIIYNVWTLFVEASKADKILNFFKSHTTQCELRWSKKSCWAQWGRRSTNIWGRFSQSCYSDSLSNKFATVIPSHQSSVVTSVSIHKIFIRTWGYGNEPNIRRT